MHPTKPLVSKVSPELLIAMKAEFFMSIVFSMSAKKNGSVLFRKCISEIND
jgi:hypothetical protein